MPVAIKAHDLSKQYHIGAKQEEYQTMRDLLADTFSAPFRRASQLLKGQASAAGDLHETFWALNGVSFDVQQGEVVGIIGRNGAGKSTLLKVLSRITEPSKGRAEVHGRVGALLEVGTGFHDELTGRENVYFNGAILGMTRMEIRRKFDEIVSFAGVEKFVDTPVKHYSSGMRLRLGFSVAAHLEPEILIVDEVLAVGDAQFQKKCLGKMSDVASAGRTVLFVSHNMVAIRSLCSRVLWLDSGKLLSDGQADQIVTDYLNTGVSMNTERIWDEPSTAPGNQYVRLHRAAVCPQEGPVADPITVNTPLVIEIDYWNLDPDAHIHLSLDVFDEQEVMAFNTIPIHDPLFGKPIPAGLVRNRCYIPGDFLNDGIYRVRIIIIRNQDKWVYSLEDALVFQVNDSPLRFQVYSWHGKWPGVVRPDLKWTIETEEQVGEPNKV